LPLTTGNSQHSTGMESLQGWREGGHRSWGVNQGTPSPAHRQYLGLLPSAGPSPTTRCSYSFSLAATPIKPRMARSEGALNTGLGLAIPAPVDRAEALSTCLPSLTSSDHAMAADRRHPQGSAGSDGRVRPTALTRKGHGVRAAAGSASGAARSISWRILALEAVIQAGLNRGRHDWRRRRHIIIKKLATSLGNHSGSIGIF